MDTVKRQLKVFNKVFSLLLVIITSFALTGCLDKNEIEDMGLVVALGVDLNDKNEVVTSVEILKPAGKSDGTNQTSMTQVYIGTGDTISDAIYKLSKKVGKIIKFSNEKCIVIGEEFAKEGIEPIIDLSLRFADMRPTDPILITKGKAFDILKFKTDETSSSAFEIEELIKRQKSLGYTEISTNLDFVNNMRGENGISTCGVISIGKDENIDKNTFILSGSAVFKKDKLIGYLDAKATRGMHWIKGKVKAGGIVTKSDNGSKIGLHILKSTSRVKVSVIDKTLKIKVNIKNQTIIDEIDETSTENIDFNRDPRMIEMISKKADVAIREEIDSAINTAQRVLYVDIFDFAGVIYRGKPNEWKNISGDWSEVFPNISIETNISSRIRQTGGMSRSINK